MRERISEALADLKGFIEMSLAINMGYPSYDLRVFSEASNHAEDLGMTLTPEEIKDIIRHIAAEQQS